MTLGPITTQQDSRIQPRSRTIEGTMSRAAWVVLERVARGGSCEVRRGARLDSEAPVAIKWLLPECARDRRVREGFDHEGTLLSRCAHEAVPRLLDRVELDGRPALVLSWLDARPLAATHNRWSPAEAVVIAAQLLRALHALHALADAQGPLGVVHRDISPANVLLSPQGRLSLIDLGLASSRLLPRPPQGLTEGTIGYHAPELFSGSDPVDPRADLFSAGVLLWELLAGRRLFPHDRLAAARAIVEDSAPDVREARPEVPAALALVVARAVSRAPAARFDSARAFALALRDAAP
jgi:serine/threonine protein kinase